MTKRRYEKLNVHDMQLVDDCFGFVAEEIANAGYAPLFNDSAEHLVNAITDYLLKCKERPDVKT